MTISEALKELYVAIGGDIDDVGNCNSSTEILNKFSVFLGGAGSATQDADAIMNIVANAGSLNPTLIDKDVTANGTYNAADDEADGYKKVVVNVAEENNAKFVYNETLGAVQFNFPVAAASLEVPDGYTNLASNLCSNGHNLKNVYIPSSITSIPANTFNNCQNLEKITINKAEGSITGAPWGAPASCQIVWLG